MSSVIIKQGQQHRLSGGPCALDLRDIAAQAEALLAAARAEADRILRDAKARATADGRNIRDAAHRAGREEGLAAGRAAGRQAALAEAREKFAQDQHALSSALSKLLDEFNQRREHLYAAARRDCVVLAIAVAARFTTKLACMEEVAPDAAVQACEAALNLLRGATQVVVRTHPDAAAALNDLQQELSRKMKASPHLRILPDEAVGRGGVRLETPEGTIDATLSSRIDRIADELVTDWRRRFEELSIKP